MSNDRERIVLKYLQSDFVVNEVPYAETPRLAESHSDQEAVYSYLLLKAGYSTFEAIRAIASHFALNEADVGYSGLKDEDAVTSQMISMSRALSSEEVETFNNNFSARNKLMKIRPNGAVEGHYEIGRLIGNNFKVVVRNVDDQVLQGVQGRRSWRAFYFVNYYGPQRFGIPGRAKVTHLVGKHLVMGDHSSALAYLRQAELTGTEDAEALVPEQCKAFFDSLDVRRQTFYRSAYSSHEWNQQLAEMMATTRKSCYRTELDTVAYTFIDDQEAIVALEGKARHLRYKRYDYDGTGKRFVTTEKVRPVTIQTNIVVSRCWPDEYHDHKHAIELLFFLPLGTYATIAIEQFVHHVGSQCG